MFVSKHMLLIHIGKTLIFHNVKTKEDVILVAGNDFSPSNINLPVDSIRSVCCSPDNKLALTEHLPTVKVIICQYPDLEVLATLIGMCQHYVANVLF